LGFLAALAELLLSAVDLGEHAPEILWLREVGPRKRLPQTGEPEPRHQLLGLGPRVASNPLVGDVLVGLAPATIALEPLLHVIGADLGVA
jgi:hypothetical protein